MSINVARTFAKNGETDELDQVILSIEFENKEVKCYIFLDSKEYTVYLDEKEVLLQAGLRAEVKSVQDISDNHGDVTIFNLYISDASVKREKRKRTTDYAIPVIIYGV